MIKNNYYPWIDSLKGIAIIMVILTHVGFGKNEYYIWYHIQQPVSLFLFCTAYLLGKKDFNGYFSKERLLRLFKRIVVPFALFTTVTFLVLLCCKKSANGYGLILSGLKNGGYGPGSYYPWIYIQFWIAIRFVKQIVEKTRTLWLSFIILMVISAMMELGFALLVEPLIGYDYSVSLWRLLFIRYNMYIWIGLCFDRIVTKPAFWIPMAVISVVLAYIDIYVTSITPSYKFDGFNFFTTFYIIPLVLLLRRFDKKWLRMLGKYSYEIFLVQMFVLCFLSLFDFVRDNPILNFLQFIPRVICIGIVSYLYILIKNKLSRKVQLKRTYVEREKK